MVRKQSRTKQNQEDRTREQGQTLTRLVRQRISSEQTGKQSLNRTENLEKGRSQETTHRCSEEANEKRGGAEIIDS